LEECEVIGSHLSENEISAEVYIVGLHRNPICLAA
jgi:hypothetical protein